MGKTYENTDDKFVYKGRRKMRWEQEQLSELDEDIRRPATGRAESDAGGLGQLAGTEDRRMEGEA